MNARDRERVTSAFALALEVLDGKLDKQGEPLIRHAVRVGLAFVEDDTGLTVAGILHDVLEEAAPDDAVVDSYTEATLRRAILTIYGERVLALVDAVTRRKGEKYFDYIQRVRSNGPAARALKEADLRDNLRPGVPASLEIRYRKALALLLGSLASDVGEVNL